MRWHFSNSWRRIQKTCCRFTSNVKMCSKVRFGVQKSSNFIENSRVLKSMNLSESQVSFLPSKWFSTLLFTVILHLFTPFSARYSINPCTFNPLFKHIPALYLSYWRHQSQKLKTSINHKYLITNHIQNKRIQCFQFSVSQTKISST